MANATTAAAAAASSINVVQRTDRSIAMFLMQHVMKPLKPVLITKPKPLPAGSPVLEINKSVSKQCDVHERKVDDIHLYDITRKTSLSSHTSADAPPQRPTKRIYYFAGGGWQSPPTSEHWKVIGEIASRLPDAVVSLVSYPLAPNSAAPVAFPQLMSLYATILKDAEEAQEEVILAGDSAGGNIILAITLHALSEDPECRCPKALLAIAPSTDLGRDNPDIQALEKHDPLLRIPFIADTAASWRGEWDAKDPRVSPLFADVAPFARRGVKVHGVTGGYDILSPDGILFRNKCRDAGVVGEWLHWEKEMHCFFLAFPFKLKESVQAVDWIIDILRRS
jgi:acetyl esterase/lipase